MLDLFAVDAAYHSMPMAPAVGKQAIRDFVMQPSAPI
jgi:hypothetical protein